MLSTEEGWTFVVVRAHELYEEPEDLLHRLVSELQEHCISIPAILCDEWRRHFRIASVAA